jgi:hypothetical protein
MTPKSGSLGVPLSKTFLGIIFLPNDAYPDKQPQAKLFIIKRKKVVALSYPFIFLSV